MQRLIEEFILKLHSEKNTSSNTEVSYKRDLTKLFIYLNNSYSTDNISDITKEELEGYISSLETIGRAPTTISRNIASMKAFFGYLYQKGYITDNPASDMKSPKIEKKAPEILSINEIDDLLKQPDRKSVV